MGFHRRAVYDPQPSAGVIGGGRRGHRGALQPVVSFAGSRGGGLLRGARHRLARRREHADRFRRPVGRTAAHAEERGARQQVGRVWGGLTLGCALVGQEPILVALRWLGVDIRQIWLPLAVSNAVFAVTYYVIVWFGLEQVAKL